jgi:hypothetical protein
MQTELVVRDRPQPATFAAELSPSVVSQLLTLANFRNLELCQAIRLARMQLPGGSPGIAAFVQEREINSAAMEQLEQLRRVTA